MYPNKDAMNRFGLTHGQFFAYYNKKNLHWRLNGEPIGFGDLRDEDILRIAEMLGDTETFEGFNEHHGTDWQQRENAVIVITHGDFEFPEAVRTTPRGVEPHYGLHGSGGMPYL